MKTQIKHIIMLIPVITLGLLCACANNSKIISSDTPESSYSAEPPVSAAAQTLDEVLQKIRTEKNDPDIPVLKAANTTEIGSEWLLVEYYVKFYNEFILYNSKTGNYDYLARNAKFLKAEDENHLFFEITGDWNDGAFFRFPYIQEYIRKAAAGEGLDEFYSIDHPGFYELSRPVKGGSKDCDKLSAVNATFNGIDFLFKPADGIDEDAFYTAASYIPPTETSYDDNTNQFTILLDKCQLDGSIRTGIEVKTDDNPYMSSYTVQQNDNAIYIVVTLRPAAAGYAMDIGKVPGDQSYDGYPYLSVQFFDEDALNFYMHRYVYKVG
jgi:hypothetical protein